jgi:hypothetical protein
MAESVHSTLLDIEQLNALAVRLRDYCDDVRHPTLAQDLDTAANVASEHAHWRFTMKEAIADLRNTIALAEKQQITVEKLFANVLNVAEDLESQTGDA